MATITKLGKKIPKANKRSHQILDCVHKRVRQFSPHAQLPYPHTVLCCFDNKKPDSPRLGLVNSYGDVQLITEGDSPVLTAIDLESVTLLDRDQNIYGASDSLGVTYVFQLQLLGGHNDGYTIDESWYCSHLGQFQLPLPRREGNHYQDKKRTNIETMRAHPNPRGQGMLITYAGRGGKGYGGRGLFGNGKCWVRTVPLETQPFGVLQREEDMDIGTVYNTTRDKHWREISDLDIVGDVCVFSTALDREEDDPLKDSDSRESLKASGRLLFDSQVVSTRISTCQSTILARIPHCKVEAVLLDPRNPHKVWVGTDDEGLGCLLGEIRSGEFLDVGMNAAHKYQIPPGSWGLSGMALGPVADQGYRGPEYGSTNSPPLVTVGGRYDQYDGYNESYGYDTESDYSSSDYEDGAEYDYYSSPSSPPYSSQTNEMYYQHGPYQSGPPMNGSRYSSPHQHGYAY